MLLLSSKVLVSWECDLFFPRSENNGSARRFLTSLLFCDHRNGDDICSVAWLLALPRASRYEKSVACVSFHCVLKTKSLPPSSSCRFNNHSVLMVNGIYQAGWGAVLLYTGNHNYMKRKFLSKGYKSFCPDRKGFTFIITIQPLIAGTNPRPSILWM